MARFTPYLFFDGKCRDAMNFYKECFGGDLHMQAVGETPAVEQMPAETRQKIMHAALTGGDFLLMASDWMSRSGLSRGNNISLSLHCTSDEEIRTLFAKLSAGGKVVSPLADQFWGATFGTLVDQFGIDWMLNFDKNAKK